MDGHRIPDKIEPVNTEWFKEGVLAKTTPEYMKNITFEDLEKED